VSTRTRQTVSATLPDLFPRLLPGLPRGAARPAATHARAGQQIGDLLASSDFDAWTEALDRVGNCALPIRLHGHSDTVDRSTGELLSTYASAQEPLGVTRVRCRNRRASECPASAQRVPGSGSTPRTSST